MLNYKALSLFFLIFIINPLIAWHDAGHMIVANVAYKNLDPKLVGKFDSLISKYSRDYPKSDNFVTASVWPDDIKAHGINFYNQWHYHDKYFSSDGTTLPKSYNSGKAYTMLKKHLDLFMSDKTTDYEKAFSLKFIIHIYGDLHQPMHNASRVSKYYPRGDLGGNFFKINDPDYKNLHSLWDSGLKGLPEIHRPMTEHDKFSLEGYSDNIMNLYPLHYFSDDVLNASYKKWQEEHIKILENNVYINIDYNQKPSSDYLKNNAEIIKKQLVLGGYRLANTLNCLYKSSKCI